MSYFLFVGISKLFPLSIPVPDVGERETFDGDLKNVKTFQLKQQEKNKIWELLEKNVKDYYEATWGWDSDSKKKELFDPGAYFLIVTSRDNELVAFSMFKLCWDDEEEPEYPVLFCYEVQVDEKYQGQGIGKRLMDIEIQIANELNLWKTMLTCFKINTKAMGFYKKIGFDIDVNSPSTHGFDADYEILSDKPKLRN